MGLTSPLPSNLAQESRKATQIFRSFVDASGGLDGVVPSDIIRSARGFAMLTVAKAGFLVSARAGTGVVIARLSNGGRSAPSAIGTGGLGFGGQAGAELTEFLIVLAAVESFQSAGSLTLGGNMSIAVGPLGRNAEGSGAINTKGKAAMMYSYSRTKGLFGGVSIEGSVIVERSDANSKAYGQTVTARQLLSGQIEVPAFADSLIAVVSERAGADIDPMWIDDRADSPHFDRHNNAQEYPFASSASSKGNVSPRNERIKAFATKRFTSQSSISKGRPLADSYDDADDERNPFGSAAQVRSFSAPHDRKDDDEDEAMGRPSLDTISSEKRESIDYDDDYRTRLREKEDRERDRFLGSTTGQGRWRSNSDATIGGGNRPRSNSGRTGFFRRKASPAIPESDFVVPPQQRAGFEQVERASSPLARPGNRSRSSSSATFKGRPRAQSAAQPTGVWGGTRKSLDRDGVDDLLGLDPVDDIVKKQSLLSSGVKPRRPQGGDYGASDPSDEELDAFGFGHARDSSRESDQFEFAGTTAKMARVNLENLRKNTPSPNNFRKTDTRAAGLAATNEGHAIALFDFSGQEAGDLSFKKHEVITIVKRGEPGVGSDWWTGRIGLKEGVFPSTYCQVVD